MTPAEWARVKELVADALEQPAPDRPAFLDIACGSDAHLRAEVDKLLAADGSPGLESPILPHPPPLEPGHALSHFRIESRLGQGGMGTVYRAQDEKLRRTVAIKVLADQHFGGPASRQRLLREARAASALNHPGIVTIYEAGTEGDTDFIAMELVDGESLDRRIPKKGLPLKQALDYAVQIAAALAKAHAAGIIHRDLKPSNVMITPEGQVKLLDFGLARRLHSAPASGATMTRTGEIMGTPAYMSPEQAEGQPLDTRSDIFSFGAVLYEMLTGARAFPGNSTMGALVAVLQSEPTPLSEDLPSGLRKLVARCLRKDLNRRFQSIADVHIELIEAQEDLASASPLSQPRRRPARRLLWPIAALLFAASALGLFLYFRPPPPAAPTTIPLTNYPGSELYPSLSPDGKQVAFSWTGDPPAPNPDIYVKLVDAGSPLRLTASEEPDIHPAWSPDGRFIAFSRQTPHFVQILIIPALGGPERVLTQSSAVDFLDGFTPPYSKLSWSADGKWIAYADRASPQSPNSIFLVSVETNEKHQLTSPSPGEGGDVQPAFSPDGTALAFYRLRISEGDLLVMPLSGIRPAGQPRTLAENQLVLSGPSWSPDGKSILFASSLKLQTDHTLRRISARGGGPEALPFAGTWPSVANSGNRMVLQRQTHNLDIWRISLNIARPTPPERLISSTSSEAQPCFSPDGLRIAYKLNFQSESGEVWLCDRDGRNARQHTTLQTTDKGSPRWSPDGRWITFDSLTAGRRDIYVIPAGGGAARQLTQGPANSVRPSYSRDGRWIYFGSDRGGSWQIWKIPAGGGDPVQVTTHGGREAFESIDGRTLFYVKFGIKGVWKMNLDGGPETQVEPTAEQGQFAVGASGIYVRNGIVPFLTGEWKLLWDLPPGVSGVGTGIAVSADEQHLLVTLIDRPGSDLVLIENFR
jgi:Tol biopolymer transport system component/predicted Ser/Thr protein kinase